MTKKEEYLELSKKLVNGRADNSITGIEEKDIEFKMERIWYMLSQKDCDYINSLPSPYSKCFCCKKWIVTSDDDALVCILCGGRNRRSRPKKFYEK